MNAFANPILLVEDDENDVFFLRYAFEGAGITNPLQVVEDGQKAYLLGVRLCSRSGLVPEERPE